MRKPLVDGIAGYESGKEIRQTSHLTVLRSNLKLYHRGSLKLSAVLLCKLEASLGSTFGAWLYPLVGPCYLPFWSLKTITYLQWTGIE